MRVETVATSAQKPSNVAVYLSVADGDRPITNLDELDFKVYEDGQLLDHAQIQQRLLPRDRVAAHRTLLLVDMSGDMRDSFIRGHIARAVVAFVNALRKTQPVTVYAFDSGKTLRFIGDYPSSDEPVEEMKQLWEYKSQDVSSNLNGAVVDALKQLDSRLASSGRSLRVGTLVVFVRGPDLAGRVAGHEMESAIEDSEHEVLAVAIEPYRPSFASDTIMAKDMRDLEATFTSAAKRVADTYNHYYLIAYCSPARAGHRSVRIEAVTKNAEGEEISGSAHAEFNADGFSAGCDSKSPPRFVAQSKGGGGSGGSGSSGGGSPPSNASPAEEDDSIVPPPDKPGYAP